MEEPKVLAIVGDKALMALSGAEENLGIGQSKPTKFLGGICIQSVGAKEAGKGMCDIFVKY